ncbi:MAG: hypothetical protein IJC35_06205 [Oscillospiraceae bacterium]|nr:hypothetical protein [Oscillospiraceae bacterium]
MAYITGQTGQGNCSTVYLKDGWYECAPVPTEACVLDGEINSWHCWFAEVNGTVGEEVNVHLNWPEADYSKMRPELQAQNYRSIWENFARCAQDAVYISYDRLNWKRIEDVALEGQQLAFSVELEEKRCWLSVTLYYTEARYEALRAAVKDHPKIRTHEIGTDYGGDVIYAFEATDFSVPEEEKIPVFLMAAQHSDEVMGTWFMDAMLRYFVAGSDSACELLKKFVFHLIPVASVTMWRHGIGLGYNAIGINPNRDWLNQVLPSTRAIAAYLDGLTCKPKLLLDIHSGLQNYGSWDTCQSITINYTLEPEKVAEMERFGTILWEHTDFMPIKRFWGGTGMTDGSAFDYYGERYGQGHCMEVSLYSMYDRAIQSHRPMEQWMVMRYGAQLAEAIGRFFDEKK